MIPDKFFFVGKARIGHWEIWVSNKSPFVQDWNLKDEYYECLFTEYKDDIPYYVNPAKAFHFFEMRHTPKELKNETEEEKMYRVHWNAYANRKDMQMPMWLMHRTVIERIIAVLHAASD